MGQFVPYITGMFLGWFSFRFLQSMTPRPKLAPPRGLSVFHRKIFKNLLLRNYWANLFHTLQECFLCGLLSDSFKLLPPGPNWPAPGLISFSYENLKKCSAHKLLCLYQNSQECSLCGLLSDTFKLLPLGPNWPHPGAYQFFI